MNTRRRHWSLLAAATVLAGVALTGCGSASTGTNENEPAPAPSAANELPTMNAVDKMTIVYDPEHPDGWKINTTTFYRPMPDGTTLLCLITYAGSASTTQCFPTTGSPSSPPKPR